MTVWNFAGVAYKDPVTKLPSLSPLHASPSPSLSPASPYSNPNSDPSITNLIVVLETFCEHIYC